MAGKEKIKITIIISGGAVQDVSGVTEDVLLTIRDYDVDEEDYKGDDQGYGSIEQDADGEWYQEMVWGEPSFEKKIIREPEYHPETGMRISPAILQCFCGNEVELYGFTNTCERCGADFNWDGQHLAPREQWGEETGEHLSDILRIQ